MIKEAIRSIKNGKKAIYVAPSKELLDFARSEIIKELGAVYNIDIFTLDDLAEKIAENFIKGKRVIDTDEKVIIIKQILKQISEGKNITRFVNIYIDIIKSLKQNDIYPKNLEEKINLIEDSFTKKKMEDVLNIYIKYEKELEKLNLIDIEDIKKIAIENCSNTDYFNNIETFIIDGFVEVFTIEAELIKAVYNAKPKIRYIYHGPANIDFVKGFAEKKILLQLKDINIEKYEEDYLNDNYFKKIASCLFEFKTLDDLNNKIKIIDASCIEDEVRQVAGKIKELVKNENIEFNDIAVITNDIEEYKEKVFEVFEEYGIPINLSRTYELSKIPFIKSIFSFLRLGLEDHNFNKIYLDNYLSSPYIPISIEDRNILRWELNKVYRGKNTKNYINELRKEDENLEKLAVFLENTELELQKFNKDMTFEKFKNQLVTFIEKNNIRGRILGYHNYGKMSDEIMIRDLKAYIAFMEELNRLEKLYSLIDEKIKLSDFITILEEALSEKTITLKKKNNAGIKLLTPTFLKGTSYFAIFVIGLNEDIFPRFSSENNLFNYEEKQYLSSIGINLGSNLDEMNKSKINFIMSVASAKEYLFLSYRTQGENGDYISKSQFIDEILSVLNKKGEYKNIRKRTIKQRFNYIKLYSNKEILNRLAILKEKEFEKYLNDEEKYRYDHILFGLNVEEKRNEDRYNSYDGLLKDEIVMDLINKDSFSVSKLNNYLNCPFLYFVKEELGVKEYKNEDLPAYKVGNVFHKIMNDYYTKIFINEEKDIKLDDIINEKIKEENIICPEEDIILKVKIEEVKKIINKFIELDCDFINNKGFKPLLLEESFEFKYKVNENISIIFKGQIDRVDIRKNSEGIYEYVIYDYKTGKPKSFADIINGEDIQLPLYYLVMEEILKEKIKQRYKIEEEINIKCLALIYYDIRETYKKGKLERDGIAICSQEEFNRYVNGNKNKANDTVIQLFGLKKNSKILQFDDRFDLLVKLIKRRIIKAVNEIYNGRFIVPYKCRQNINDFYNCDYKDICRYNQLRINRKEW